MQYPAESHQQTDNLIFRLRQRIQVVMSEKNNGGYEMDEGRCF